MESALIDGFEAVTLRPHDLRPGAPHAVYLHGGGYIMPILRAHWMIIDALMRRTAATVTIPMYPLAPEHTVDDALGFLDAVMLRVRSSVDGKSVVYVADSAGGGLALAHTLRQRDLFVPLPSALALFAPWVDVSMTNPDIAGIESRDLLLKSAQLETCGSWWAGNRAATDPSISPVYGDLRGLPPIHTFVGDHDILLPDISRLHQRIRDAGGTSTLTVTPGGFHGYVGALRTPEARRTLDQAAEIFRQNENT